MAKTEVDENRPEILLDTCALLFIALGKELKDAADTAVGAAAYRGDLYVSPISAWEIGKGVSKGRLNLPLTPLAFFNDFVANFQARLAELTPEILIHSSLMPGEPHNDPMDRILVATARLKKMVLVTSDVSILKYGKAGHVRVLAC